MSAWANLKCGDKLGDRVTGRPDPEVMDLVAQGGEEFVQLEMAEGQVLEEVSVNVFGMLASAREPETNGHFRMVEEQGRIGDGQAQVDGPEDLSGGSSETIQSSAAPTGKAFAACLTTQPLDAVRAAFAVTDQRMIRSGRCCQSSRSPAVGKRTRRCKSFCAYRANSYVHARARRSACARCPRWA